MVKIILFFSNIQLQQVLQLIYYSVMFKMRSKKVKRLLLMMLRLIVVLYKTYQQFIHVSDFILMLITNIKLKLLRDKLYKVNFGHQIESFKLLDRLLVPLLYQLLIK
jgi:hypothetical protein